MDERGFTGRWMGRFRTLTLALIFSGALNIALIATLAFFLYEEHRLSFELSPLITSQEAVKFSNSAYLSNLSQLHFRELVAQLTNRDRIEDGYVKRDLALAMLVSNHSFYLEKALEGSVIQRRPFRLNEGRMIELFPGLSEEQFQAILRYAYQEKWPFTPQGLFARLQQSSDAKDPSLLQAFVLSPEFHAVRILFQKSGAPLEEESLVRLLVEGDWELLERFVKEESLQLDLSIERRRDFLMRYLSRSSPMAALLLLRTDALYVLKNFEDQRIIDLLSLLPAQQEEGRLFAVDLLRSPRSDAVHQKSAAFLFRSVGEVPSPMSSVEETLDRFAPNRSTSLAKIAPRTLVEPPVKPLVHVVKEGESLWKISRQYKIKLEELVALNGLVQERLLPGMELMIPVSKNGEKDGK